MYLILRFFGLRVQNFGKWSKIEKIAKFNTFKYNILNSSSFHGQGHDFIK